MGFLSRIGIGSAEVDTILERERVQPGETIPARIEIEGGSEDQDVDDIELAVMTRYEVETDDGTTYRNVAVCETELTDGFTIREGEEDTMDAVEGLGFRLSEIENVKASWFGPHEFAQEYEYKPTAGSRYTHDLDEIELFPARTGDGFDVVVEVDKRGESLFGRDESHHRITVDTTDIDRVERRIGTLIDEQL